MIHTFHTMTIDRFVQMKHLNDESLMKKWYNPFPVKWFNTSGLIDDFNAVFGNLTSLQKQVYAIEDRNVIKILQIAYDIAVLMTTSQSKISVYSILLKRKAKPTNSKLQVWRDKILYYTRIDIFKKDGLKHFEGYINREVDKYNQTRHYENQGEANNEEINFMVYALRIFDIINQPFNGKVTLFQLSLMKERADEIIAHQKQKGNGNN